MKYFLLLFTFFFASACALERGLNSTKHMSDEEKISSAIQRDPQFSKKNTFPDENWISLRSGSIIFPQNSNCIIEERIDPRFSVFSRKMFKIDCFE